MAARWPTLILVVAVIAAMISIDDGHDRPESAVVSTPPDAVGYQPVTAPESAISSTWFCAGGTADPDGGNADHTVIVANVGSAALDGTVTAYPNAKDVDVGTEAFTVQSGETLEFHLADLAPSAFTAGLVELNGGGVVVEHRVVGPTGRDVAPCASRPSPDWYFAAGQTTRDALEVLVFFNPFPDPAVVDVTFRTEQDIREPQEFDGLIIPPRSVIARELSEFVTRRARVSTSVEARAGRIVVDRIMVRDGVAGVEALDVALGSPVPAEVWFSPDGLVSEAISEEFVIYNPGESVAEVDLVVEPVAVEGGAPQTIEPFALTVPPDGFQEVILNEETRIGEALEASGAGRLRHSTRVVSLNAQPVVVERTITGDQGSGRPGHDIAALAALLSDQLTVAGAPEGAIAALVIQNPSGETAARVSIRALSGAGSTEVEVPAAGQAEVALADVAISGPVIIESSAPIAVERRLTLRDETTSQTVAVPLFGSITLPEPVS